MSDLQHKSATELAALIRARKLSSRELLELYLQRIAAHNPTLNAVVTLDEEGARKAARTADDELATRGPRGPLHGLPITVKDAYETAGMRSTSGAKPWANHVPEHNAVAVQRLVDAGAFVIGKTNVPAYCGDMQSYNDIFGVTKNPHDLERTPGGSSGGAAVSVACGFTAFELGSDIGGSIRTPAHWTGVYGHKPTYGIVPQRGHLPPGPGVLWECDLSVCGPLARSAGDLALTLDVLAGPDRLAAKGYRLQLPRPRASGLRDYRAAVWLDDEAFPVDAEVASVLEAAIQGLEKSGMQLDRGARPERSLQEITANYFKLLHSTLTIGWPDKLVGALQQLAAAPVPEDPLQAPLFVFARNATASHSTVMLAAMQREQERAQWERFFQSYDVLLCPVTGNAAIPHQHEGTPVTRTLAINGKPAPYYALMSWISMATSAHLPATVVPVGRTRSGLPVGLQVVGAYLEDHTTIDVAARIGEIIGGFVPPERFA
jgi:amidase